MTFETFGQFRTFETFSNFGTFEILRTFGAFKTCGKFETFRTLTCKTFVNLEHLRTFVIICNRCEHLRPLATSSYNLWSFETVCDCLRLFVTICDGFWPFVIICDRLRTVCDFVLLANCYIIHLALLCLSVILSVILFQWWNVAFQGFSCSHQTPNVGSMLGHCLRCWTGGRQAEHTPPYNAESTTTKRHCEWLLFILSMNELSTDIGPHSGFTKSWKIQIHCQDHWKKLHQPTSIPKDHCGKIWSRLLVNWVRNSVAKICNKWSIIMVDLWNPD